MSEKFDKDLFEKVFCVNTIFDQQYATSVAEHFNPIFFNDTNIGIVLKKVVNFLQEKSVLPNTTELKLMFVSDADKKALMSVLQDIKDMDKTYNQDELYENTELFLRERAVYNSLLKVVDIVKSNNVDPNAILDEFTASCNISLVDSLGFDYLNKIDEHARDLIKPNNTIPTGFKWLDDRICGGWQAEGKALYLFSGFTNAGKSIFLQHVSMAGLRDNKNVLLISLEMSEHMYSRRISANISQIAYNNLPNYIDDLKASVVQLRDSLSSKIIIKEFPTKSVTVTHINAFIRKLIKKGFKPDMIVLDYLNLLKSAKTHTGTYDEVKHIAEQLRASTYLFNVPIITATQLGRCLSLDTIVKLKCGTNINISDIKIGDVIKSNDNFVSIKHIFPTIKKPAYRITTKSGKTIVCSREHLFPTTDGEKSILSGLKINDKLFIDLHS